MRDEDTARDLVEGPPEGVGTGRLVPAVSGVIENLL